MGRAHVRIRAASTDDAAVIAAIYNYFIEHTRVTFEETPVDGDEIADRITKVRAAGLPWLVATDDDRVIGYAYAAPWRSRRGYRFSVEVTVYVEPGREGQGVGTALYEHLFVALEATDVHAALGGIVLPNPASVALHEKLGMKKVAHLDEVGTKFGAWIDVGYWQRLL